MKNNKLLSILVLFLALLIIDTSVMAANKKSSSSSEKESNSILRISCDGEDAGAEVHLNGKFRGECPVDITITEGSYKLKVFKAIDEEHERVFEQELRIGEGNIKKVEALLNTRLSAVGEQRKNERDAAERVQAIELENKRLAEAAVLAEQVKKQENDKIAKEVEYRKNHEWIEDSNSCKIYNPTLLLNYSITWSGVCVDGFASGPGKVSWFENRVFKFSREGEYVKGKLNGHGVKVDSDGKRTEGEYKDGHGNGHFIYTFANGTRSEGEMKNSEWIGHWVYTTTEGTTNEGEFKNGLRTGLHIEKYLNGSRCECEYKDDKRNGRGLWIFPDGEHRILQYKDGEVIR